MKVHTAELRAVVNALLDHLDGIGQSEFDVAEDFYWNVPQQYVYNPYESPAELDLGQLSDDLQKLREVLSGENPPVGCALVWLAALLRRIGEKAEG